MNPINDAIFYCMTELGKRSWFFDKSMAFLLDADLFKGGLIMALYWWIWFARGEEAYVRKRRETVMAIFAGAFLALVLAMFFAVILHFQLRPIHDPAFLYKLPHGVHKGLETWSAFPSDHASLFTALAAGLWFISRRLALLTMLYVIVVIFLPRIYLGLHYPEDLAGGMVLAVVCVALTNIPVIKRTFAQPILALSERYPGLFYSLFFLLSFQIATLFHSFRELGRAMKTISKHILGG
jgi:undecaprenyl-diphosphatase